MGEYTQQAISLIQYFDQQAVSLVQYFNTLTWGSLSEDTIHRLRTLKAFSHLIRFPMRIECELNPHQSCLHCQNFETELLLVCSVLPMVVGSGRGRPPLGTLQPPLYSEQPV